MKRALAHFRQCDQTLAGIIDRIGPYRIEYRQPGFDTLVRSIIFQQLSGKAAATIYSRLAAATGDGVTGVTPDALLRLRTPRWKSLGVSQQKQSYLKDLATRTQEGKLNFAGLARMTDEEVIEHLTSVKGVGVWTAQMFLMFALRRPDVFPTGDLGIRNALHRTYALPAPPAPVEMLLLSERWRPYRTIACWYLWKSLDGPAAL